MSPSCDPPSASFYASLETRHNNPRAAVVLTGRAPDRNAMPPVDVPLVLLRFAGASGAGMQALLERSSKRGGKADGVSLREHLDTVGGTAASVSAAILCTVVRVFPLTSSGI